MSVESYVIDTPFEEVQFPPKISYGSSGGPGFKTSAFAVDSGLIGGVAVWEKLRARYDVVLDYLTTAEMELVQNHFYAMRGRAIGFRYKDWSDFNITSQNFFVADGTATVYPLFKRYASGAFKFDRPISKLVASTVSGFTLDGVAKTEGVDFTVNYNTGEFTMTVAPVRGVVGHIGAVEFDVPVRYDTDILDIQIPDYEQRVVSSVPMVEILI